MATEKQYEFFKFLFNQEEDRRKELLERGKAFLTIFSFYLGLLMLTTNTTIKPVSLENQTQPIATLHVVGIGFLIGAILLFLVALLFTLMSLGIYSRRALADPEKIIYNFGATPPEDADFFDHRIVEFSVTTERTRVLNNRRANRLRLASILMFCGALSHIIFIILTNLF